MNSAGGTDEGGRDGDRFGVRVVPRPRLVGPLLRSDLSTVIEAGSGYGKTTLIDQLIHDHHGPHLVVRLVHRRRPGPDDLVGMLIRAGTNVGMSGLEVLSPQATAADTAEALATEADLLVLIDDAHELSEDGGRWIANLLEITHRSTKFVVAARHLPDPLRRLELKGLVGLVTGDDLGLDDAETRTLTELELGRAASPVWQMVQRRTGGWAALTGLVVRRLAASPDPAAAAFDLLDRKALLSEIVDHDLARLDDRDRRTAIQLAHLPSIDMRAAEAIGGSGIIGRMHHVGLPLIRRSDGRWEFPSVVQDHLIGQAEVEPDTILTAAPMLVADGLTVPTAHLLIDSGFDDDAAALISTLSWMQIDALEPREVVSLIDRLGASADRQPRCLLALERALHSLGDVVRQQGVMDRAVAAADSDSTLDPGARLAVLVEDVFQQAMIDATPEHVDALDRLAPDIVVGSVTAARALEARSIAMTDQNMPARLDEAERCLREAIDIYDRTGEQTLAISARRSLVLRVLVDDMRLDEGESVLARVLDNPSVGGLERIFTLAHRLRLLTMAGAIDEARAVEAEMRPTLELVHIPWLHGWLEWYMAGAETYVGDTARTIERLDAAADHLSSFLTEKIGWTFLTEAVEWASALGIDAEAQRYVKLLDDVEDGAPGRVRLAREIAASVLEPDDGSLDRLTERIAEVNLVRARMPFLHQILALTAARLGDADRARDERAAAARWAEDVGRPELVWPSLDAQIDAALAGTPVGSTGEAARPTRIEVFDRFRVLSGSAEVGGARGKPADLVKLVVLHRGRVHVDVAQDYFWPEGDPVVGRRRLRNVLARAKATYGSVVERRGEMLVLGDGVTTDLSDLDAAIREASTSIADRSVASRRALGLVTGPLLPDDRFDEAAEQERDHLRERLLSLAAVALDESLNDPDLDGDDLAEVLRSVESIDPYHVELHLRAGEEVGRRGPPSLVAPGRGHDRPPSRRSRCRDAPRPARPGRSLKETTWGRPDRVGRPRRARNRGSAIPVPGILLIASARGS